MKESFSNHVKNFENSSMRIGIYLINFLIIALIQTTPAVAKEGKVFLRIDPVGHTAQISDIFFFDNGKKLISASVDKTIRIWDVSELSNPKLLYTIRGEIGTGSFGKIFTVALSPDERILAVGGYLYDDSNKNLIFSVRLHDIRSGNVIGILKGHNDVVHNLAFSPDGRFLASGSGDHTIIIWKKDKEKYKLYKRLKGHKGSIYSVSFSRNRFVSGALDDTVRLYEMDKDFRLIKVIDQTSQVNAVNFSPDGKFLVVGLADKTIQLYNSDGQYIKEFAAQHDSAPIRLAFSPDGRFLETAADPKRKAPICYLYYFPDGRLVKEFKVHKNTVTAVASLIRDGRHIFASAGGERKEILLWDESGEIILRIDGGGSSVYSVALSPDAKIGFGVTVMDDIEKTTANNLGPLEKAFDTQRFTLTYLRNDSGFMRGSYTNGEYELRRNVLLPKLIGIGEEFSYLEVRHKGETLATVMRGMSDGHIHSCYSFINSNYFVSGGGNGFLTIYNIKGEKIAELVGHESDVKAVSVSSDGKWLVSGSSDQTIRLWYIGNLRDVNWGDEEIDLKKLKKAYLRAYEKYMTMTWLADVKQFDRLAWKAIINWFKCFYMPIKKMSPTLTIYPTNNNEWVAWTPEGYFAASSPSAMRSIGYHINQGFDKLSRFIPFNQLYDVYFRPDLVRLKLEKPAEDLTKYTDIPRVEDALTVAPPPLVEIISPEDGDRITEDSVSVKVRVRDMGGKIGDIRIYHNGKLVDSEGVYRLAKSEGRRGDILVAKADNAYVSRNGVVLRRPWKTHEIGESQEFAAKSGIFEKVYRVKLIAGENIISANAMNGKNTVISSMAQIRVNVDMTYKEPRLFILAVGINKYKGAAPLTAAAKDAVDFVDLMKDRASSFYGEVRVRVLTDKPGKKEIISELTDFATDMLPTDRFILFAAGHGIVTDDRYWLITSDYDGILSADTSIPSEQLMELLKSIPALRQVLVLDTCHSGALDFAFSGLYENRFTSLALDMGMHVLAGAASDQAAYEDAEKYGHGLFTFYVLKAIEGKADANSDGKVTVIEVGSYVRGAVEKASTGQQKPFITNFGEDVLMGKVK